MKLWWKKHYILFLAIGSLFVWFLFVFKDYHMLLKGQEEYYYAMQERCQKENLAESRCVYYKDKEFKQIDAIQATYNILSIDGMSMLQLIAPIFVMMVSIYGIHRNLKSKQFKNEITRMSYFTYLKRHYLESMRGLFVFPIFLFLIFIIMYFVVGNVDYSKLCNGAYCSDITPHLMNHAIFFFIIYFLNFTINGIFWINLTWICTKKNKNILVAFLASFLLYFGISALTDTLIGGWLCGQILRPLLGISRLSDYVYLSGVVMYEGVSILPLTLIYPTILVIVTFIILFYLYRNKENAVIQNEK